MIEGEVKLREVEVKYPGYQSSKLFYFFGFGTQGKDEVAFCSAKPGAKPGAKRWDR